MVTGRKNSEKAKKCALRWALTLTTFLPPRRDKFITTGSQRPDSRRLVQLKLKERELKEKRDSSPRGNEIKTRWADPLGPVAREVESTASGRHKSSSTDKGGKASPNGKYGR